MLKPSHRLAAMGTPSIDERYCRALNSTGPKFASIAPSSAIEGAWIDTDRYFYVVEKPFSPTGTLLPIPCIADAKRGVARELIAPSALLDLLEPMELSALSNATWSLVNATQLAIHANSSEYLIDLASMSVVRTRASQNVPGLYSPDGRYVVFLREFNLWAEDRESGKQWALTTDGAQHWAYGRQPETCLSAVSYRTRPAPVGIWSGDSEWFLTHRIDERGVPEMPLVENVPRTGGRPILHTFRYAVPGDPLPMAVYVAVHMASGNIVELSEFPVPISVSSPFVYRRAWFDGAHVLSILRLDRYCKMVDLIRFDLLEKSGRVILREQASAGYLDLTSTLTGAPNIRTLPASNEIIWFSERDGSGHLYLHDYRTGELKNRITEGDWQVREIVHIDEREGRILLLASGFDTDADPARRSLCRVNFDGTNFEIVAHHDGDLSVAVTEPTGPDHSQPYQAAGRSGGISPDGRFGAVRFMNACKGDEADVVDLASGKRVRLMESGQDRRGAVAQRIVVRASDDKTLLHGILFLPSNFDAANCYALIDHIYPGPQIAQQPQSYRPVKAGLAMSLAELGFATLMLDTRATPIGDREWRQASYGQLLEPQLSDHAAAVRQLCETYSYLDRDRVGIIGQSGGGAAVVRALCEYGQVFKVGVAACGDHKPDLYAAAWSDKYRGPVATREWDISDNTCVAHKLEGKLLIITGDMDENVHPSQSLSLVDALIRANRDFELLVIPNAGHDVLTTNGYALRRSWDYFVRNLLGETPPGNFLVQYKPEEIARFRKKLQRENRQ